MEMFCIKEVDVTLPKPSAGPETFSLLDLKRSKNLGILLGSRFKKLEFSEMREAIMNMDEKVLSAGDVQALTEYIPTKDEVPINFENLKIWPKFETSKPFFRLRLLKVMKETGQNFRTPKNISWKSRISLTFNKD